MLRFRKPRHQVPVPLPYLRDAKLVEEARRDLLQHLKVGKMLCNRGGDVEGLPQGGAFWCMDRVGALLALDTPPQ